eukprot:PhM_4_TR6078/c0_g1_i1/m.33764
MQPRNTNKKQQAQKKFGGGANNTVAQKKVSQQQGAAVAAPTTTTTATTKPNTNTKNNNYPPSVTTYANRIAFGYDVSDQSECIAIHRHVPAAEWVQERKASYPTSAPTVVEGATDTTPKKNSTPTKKKSAGAASVNNVTKKKNFPQIHPSIIALAVHTYAQSVAVKRQLTGSASGATASSNHQHKKRKLSAAPNHFGRKLAAASAVDGGAADFLAKHYLSELTKQNE